MISGNIEKFSSPVRNIVGKVELSCEGSTPTTLTGNPIVITDAVPGSPIEVQVVGTADVNVCGKNLFDISKIQTTTITESQYAAQTEIVEVGSDYFAIKTYPGYTGNGYTMTNVKLSDFCPALRAGDTFMVSADTESFQKMFYLTPSGTVLRFGYAVQATEAMLNSIVCIYGFTNNNSTPQGVGICRTSNIQFELGTTATEYETYQGQTTTINTAGRVNALDGFTLISSSAAMNITYQKPSVEVKTYTHDGTLKAITVERTGESKFFGFGIGQKANIKIIDKERTCVPTTSHYAHIYFDDVRPLPLFYVSEVHRDENTNEVSITLYDRLYDTANYTVSELGIETYTIGEFAGAAATFLGLGISLPAIPEFELAYEEGANFNGTESLRDALNDVAEATQTIYYINSNDELVFKRLDKDGAAVHTIDKNQYITLDTKTNRRLTSIVSATELGDNIEASNGLSGTAQVIHDNAFWDLREDRGELVEDALAAVENLTINQFDCSWRGCYLLEPGDKLGLIAKDGSEVFSYLLNDTITYDGSFSQKTEWEYAEEDVEHSNPVSLGEALKQTIAKVDKANQEISLMVSSTNETLEGINGELEQISTKVSTTVSKDDVEILISETVSKGVNKVETSTGFTFNDEGLTVSKSDSDISTTITEDGMTVKKGGEDVLTASNEGVKAIDLHATTYLIIGNNSRFEDYNGNRTACFWIGG